MLESFVSSGKNCISEKLFNPIPYVSGSNVPAATLTDPPKFFKIKTCSDFF